nr:reverse transcriptase domain-containing protein [Tanacetum cinerariifolium]
DTFYNALNSKDQDSLNSAAGGNFLDKMPRECLAIIRSKSKVRYSRNKPVVAKAPAYQAPAPQTQGVSKEDFSAYVKANEAVMRNMQTQGQNMQNQLTNLTDLITKFVNSNSASTSSSGTLPSNTIANPRSDLKAITTRSSVSYDGPQIPLSTSFLPKVVENEPKATKDIVNPTNNGSTEDVQPHVMPDALILMPKFASTLKALIGNKEKFGEMARTPLNEHCSAVLLKKLPEKLGYPGKFLIPCDSPGMVECLALADLSASINLPFSVWKRLTLPDLTPTCMTLELADRSISRPVRVAEDVYVKVGLFHFPADFVVVDFYADPRVPLILGRSFLKTERALIDVFEANYSDMTAKRIDVIDMACEEYSQEVLGFSDTISSGNTTPYYDPIISITSPTLTPLGNCDFLLEEVDAFLAIEDEPTLPEFYQLYLDPEGAKSDKSSVDEPPTLELKDLPPHLEYAFLEGDDKLPVIIAKDLSVEEKTALITVLKSHNDYAIGAVLGQCQDKHFRPIHYAGKTMTEAESNYTTTEKEMLAVVFKCKIALMGFTTPGIHLQTSGQVEVSNRGLKRILERAVGENRASWSDKLDDALWAFRTAYKIPIGYTPYKLVYEKACHLPFELEHKVYWALKHANLDVKIAGDHKKVQINELNELHDQAYENSLIYKEKTKRLHDSKIKNCVFNISDRVLLFNSRLKIFSRKLKSRWFGPFTISQVYPYGTVELSQPDRPNFKVNGHRLKHYFGENIPKVVVPDLQNFSRDH